MTLVEFLRNRPPNATYTILELRPGELYRAWTARSALAEDWAEGPPPAVLCFAKSLTGRRSDPEWQAVYNHSHLLKVINHPGWEPEFA